MQSLLDKLRGSRGTLSLYAAFNTKTGAVLGKTAERHTSAEFVAFLSDIIANQPRGKEIHVIADNLPQVYHGRRNPRREQAPPGVPSASVAVAHGAPPKESRSAGPRMRARVSRAAKSRCR